MTDLLEIGSPSWVRTSDTRINSLSAVGLKAAPLLVLASFVNSLFTVLKRAVISMSVFPRLQIGDTKTQAGSGVVTPAAGAQAPSDTHSTSLRDPAFSL